MVEPVGEGCEVGLSVFAELHRLVVAGQHGLEVAQHRVDPLELGQVTRLVRLHYLGRVDATGLSGGCKAGQPFTEHRRFGQQAGLGPLGVGLGCESADHVELHAHRLVRSVERHRRHERQPVLRASARLASRTLTTEVGVVYLHRTAEQPSGFLARHGAVDLVVQQPGRGVAHAQVPLEGQRRNACLGLADEVDGQEPGGQRHLGVFHQGAVGGLGLKSAAVALVELAGALHHKVVLRAGALREAKALRPTRALKRLGAEVSQKPRHRHAALELDLVAGPQGSPSTGELRLRAQGSLDEPAEAGF
jgi:hypothetical protein